MALSVGDVAGDASVLTSDWIAATLRLLTGTQHPNLNVLASDISHLATQIPFTYDLGPLQQGSRICVDLEVMYVWSVDTNTKTVTVQRGVDGSTALAHSKGTVTQVNPRYSQWEIFDALNSELRGLPTNDIYQIRTLTLSAVAGREGYDFPTTGYLGIADIRWQLPGTVTNEWPELEDFLVSHDLPIATFPSGSAIFFTGHLPTPQQPIVVRYKSLLTTLTTLDDDTTATGIPVTALDVPPLGAALRITNGRPVGRAQYDAQGDTRRPDEVRVSEVLQAPAALRAQYEKRVAEEAGRLRRQWPDRTRARVTL